MDTTSLTGRRTTDQVVYEVFEGAPGSPGQPPRRMQQGFLEASITLPPFSLFDELGKHRRFEVGTKRFHCATIPVTEDGGRPLHLFIDIAGFKLTRNREVCGIVAAWATQRDPQFKAFQISLVGMKDPEASKRPLDRLHPPTSHPIFQLFL